MRHNLSACSVVSNSKSRSFPPQYLSSVAVLFMFKGSRTEKHVAGTLTSGQALHALQLACTHCKQSGVKSLNRIPLVQLQ